MGVPTLTLCSESHQGQPLMRNQGASLLIAAGLQDWVAQDEADFVRLAVAKSADLTALAQRRRGLRAQVQQSPLMDAPRFAQALDNALRRMWDRKWGASGAQ
jgi:predicted O-linked N-acetylglucosamine transferase (SPINDLY family)